MSQPILIELNSHNGPQVSISNPPITTMSVRNGAVGVNVIDIRYLRDFSLVELTEQLRDRVQFSDQGEYVGGLLNIDYVYMRTSVIDGIETGRVHYRRVHVSSVDSPCHRIRAGDLYLCNLDYPQIAANATNEMIANRFYHDAAAALDYKSRQYVKKHGKKSIDEFRKNQYELMIKSADITRAMRLFENGPVYPEEIIQRLEEDFEASGVAGLVEGVRQMGLRSVTYDDSVKGAASDDISEYMFEAFDALAESEEFDDFLSEEEMKQDDELDIDDLGGMGELDLTGITDYGMDIDFDNLDDFGN